jgi:hypothetical protein
MITSTYQNPLLVLVLVANGIRNCPTFIDSPTCDMGSVLKVKLLIFFASEAKISPNNLNFNPYDKGGPQTNYH